jgi:hypothetical protein
MMQPIMKSSHYAILLIALFAGAGLVKNKIAKALLGAAGVLLLVLGVTGLMG